MSGFRGVEQSGRPYRLSRREMERRGRVRTLLRTSVVFGFLLLLQWPLRAVSTGAWPSRSAIDGAVPARLSLLVDVAMIAAYVVVAVRALELVVSARPRSVPGVRATRLGFGLVLVGAALDLVEDVLVWRRLEGVTEAQDVDLTLPWSWLMRLLVLGGLGLSLAMAWWCSRRGDDAVGSTVGSPKVADAPQDQPVVERPERVICCSGGGIRSASFCLGGLQTLQERGIYGGADSVVGVSGGGYTAAALHVLRWRSELEATAVPWGAPPGEQASFWPELSPGAFAPDSPEEKWLRRHTRYLFDSAQAAVMGLLSVLFGVAVNLVMVLAVLGTAAWLLGWLFLASGGITGWDTADAHANGYAGSWGWAGQSWTVVALGAGCFVLLRVVDRYGVLLDDQTRSLLRSGVVWLLGVGAGATVLLLGVPLVLVGLHDYAASSGSVYATAIRALGFLPESVCRSAAGACGSSATGGGASTTTVSVTSVGAIIAAILAAVRAVGATAGEGDAETSGLASLVGRIWTRVKGVVLPWVAAVGIVVVGLVMFLRWTATFVAEPDLLGNWSLAFGYAALVAAAFVLTDANRTSLHDFYEERLSYAYLLRRVGGRPEPIDYRVPLRFSEATPPSGQGPGLVTCAVANVTDLDVVPTDRDCTSFVFTHDRIGLSDEILPLSALADSTLYEFATDWRFRGATIGSAVAVSGAAFSPLAGRENARVGPYRLVLALANARLGVWLPNPLWLDEPALVRRMVKVRAPEARRVWRSLAEEHRSTVTPGLTDRELAWVTGDGEPDGVPWQVRLHRGVERVRAPFTKPGAFLVGREAFGRTSVLDRFLYVTDGGHYDNLGLVEALRAAPKELIVFDASNDPEDSFDALGRAIATARMDLGADVDFDPRGMRRLDKRRSPAAWGHGTVSYRQVDPETGKRLTGEIWVAKLIMLDDLPWDVEAYAAANPSFPRTSTSNQLYGEFDLEAYRLLGREVARKLSRPISRPAETQTRA